MHQVAVVGSGLAALTLLYAAHDAGVDVLWVRTSEPPHPSGGAPASSDHRGIALSIQSVAYCDAWGLQSAVSRGAVIESVHVSTQGRYGTLRLQADEMGLPYLGRVVPAAHLYQTLQDAVSAISVASCVCAPHEIQRILNKAQTVVLADGMGHALKAALALHTLVDDYHQTALAFDVCTQAPHDHVAYERFLPTGPLAFLPTEDPHRSAVVWCLPTPIADAYHAMTKPHFCDRLQKAFGHRLGRLHQSGAITTFPLKRLRTRPLQQPGFILLGNMASLCHPVGGQGFNLVLRDIKRWVDCWQHHGDDTDASRVRATQAAMHADHARITQTTHALVDTAGGVHWPTSVLAGQALWWLDAMPHARSWLAQQAIGQHAMHHGRVQAQYGEQYVTA